MALEAVVYSMPQEQHFGYSPYNTLPWCDEPCDDGEWDPTLLASLVQDVGEWDVDLSDKGASPEREAAAAVCATMTTEVVASAAAAARRRKRRRTKAIKNEDEMESQRMTHIAVERNRRRQMNEYLAALRSLMPPSYAQRGDQASIVGGAINYVRELEQLLQSLEVHKSRKDQSSSTQSPFVGFFTFPRYSTTSAASHSSVSGGDDAGKIDAETTTVTEGSSFSRPAAVVADVEATMAEGHASVKVHAPRRRPRQLLRLATGLQRLGLTTLHLNVTAADAMVMYSFSFKVEDGCKIGSVEEIATAVHEILGRIQEQEQEVAGFS